MGRKSSIHCSYFNGCCNRTISTTTNYKETRKKRQPTSTANANDWKGYANIFRVHSWTLPSGLVVYFLTGNIFRIGQQALIIRIEDKEDKSDKTEKDNEENEETPETKQQEDPRKNRKKRRRK